MHVRLRFWIVIVALVCVGVWLLFIDSHSIVRRVSWSRELSMTTAENARIEAEIDALQVRLDDISAPAVIEQVAREQYGMRRPGETVYRVSDQ